jgi:hypothetical protein
MLNDLTNARRFCTAVVLADDWGESLTLRRYAVFLIALQLSVY